MRERREEGEGLLIPTAPEGSYSARGLGSQIVGIDPETEIVFTRLAEVPIEVSRKGTTFSARSRFRTDWLFESLGAGAKDAHLRLRVTVTDNWVGRPLAELETASGARAAWLVRFGDALLPTASTVLQSGDHLVMAVTDELTERVHRAVETSPEKRQH